MEEKGLCHVCGKPAKLYTCQLCGARVCSSDYNSELKICPNHPQYNL